MSPSPPVPPPAPSQFALTQFSHDVLHHFDFNTFRRTRDPSALLRGVDQLRQNTRTATAIRSVL